VFVYGRAWLDLAVLGCTGLILLLLRQAYPWDILSLLAWLGPPIIAGRADRLAAVRDARIIAVVFISVAVFGNSLMPTWLDRVFA
jgi:hypothetical protein